MFCFTRAAGAARPLHARSALTRTLPRFARCGPFGPAAGPSGPLRALRARCGRFAPAGLFAWLLVVARLPGWSWQPVCPATFLPGSNPVVSSGQGIWNMHIFREEADFDGPGPWEGLPDPEIEVSDANILFLIEK